MKAFKLKFLRLKRQISINLVTRLNIKALTTLIFGLIIGFCLAELFVLSTVTKPNWKKYLANFMHDEFIQEEKDKFEIDASIRNKNYKNSSIAMKLYKEVRVLCFILTAPKNHERQARHIKNTWGKRCNKLLFMSTKKDQKLNTIALNISEGHYHMWAKTKAAYKYIYKNHYNEADWFLKANDDGYIVLENLRYMLYPYSPKTPIYFTKKYDRHLGQHSISGGSNYVLSKEALRRFVLEALIYHPNYCRSSDNGAEDVEMSKCLAKVNLTAGETCDAQGRARFFPLNLIQFILQYYKNRSYFKWLQKNNNSSKNYATPHCCSKYAVSFHSVTSTQMYILDFFIYNLKIFGIVFIPEALPKRLKVGETVAYENLESSYTAA